MRQKKINAVWSHLYAESKDKKQTYQKKIHKYRGKSGEGQREGGWGFASNKFLVMPMLLVHGPHFWWQDISCLSCQSLPLNDTAKGASLHVICLALYLWDCPAGHSFLHWELAPDTRAAIHWLASHLWDPKRRALKTPNDFFLGGLNVTHKELCPDAKMCKEALNRGQEQ